MPGKVVAVLSCGHTKIVYLSKAGDTIGSGDKVFCMDCVKEVEVSTIR